MSKPLFKTPYVNMPLSIQEPWRDFFDGMAASLGISRNGAICLALKFGGPILAKYVEVMKKELKGQCDRIGRSGETPSISEILGPPAHADAMLGVKGHERTSNTTRTGQRGPTITGRSQKGH
jgi:hypothetical protein